MGIPIELLHIPTVYVTAGFLYIMVSFAAWLMLKRQGSEVPTIWCVGGGIMGTGIILLGFRSWIPLWVTFTLGNSMLVLGNLVHILALRKELGKGFSWVAMLGLYLLIMIPFLYLLLDLQSPMWRFIWNMQCLALLCGYTAWLSKKIADKENNKSAYWLAVVYALLLFTMSSRGLMPLLGWAGYDALANDWSGLWIIVGVVITSVIGNLAIIGLYLERALVRNQALSKERQDQMAASLLSERVSDQYRKSSLNEMSDALAHELGQPITGVLFDGNMIALRCSKLQISDEQILGSLRSLKEQASRIKDITDSIRKFSTKGQADFEVLDLWHVIDDVKNLMAHPVQENRLSLKVSINHQSAFVMGSRVLLTLVFINIIRNSLQASQSDRKVVVNISLTCLQSEVRVLIEDDGPGFTTEALQKIGSEYFSTKDEGMGFGLILSRRIVEQHNGSLQLKNGRQRGGASIELNFPLWTNDRAVL